GKHPPKLLKEETIINARLQAVEFGHAHQLQNAAVLGQRLESGTLIKAQQSCNLGKALAISEHMAIEEAADLPSQPWPLIMLFDLRASTFDYVPVLHTGGTSTFTGTTIKTAVDVSNKRFRNRQPSGIDLQHLVDAAAGRIHLHTQHTIRRAMIQAKTAVHAGSIEIPGWTIWPGKIRFPHLQGMTMLFCSLD